MREKVRNAKPIYLWFFGGLVGSIGGIALKSFGETAVLTVQIVGLVLTISGMALHFRQK